MTWSRGNDTRRCAIYTLSLYSATLRSKSKRKKGKNRQEKRYCGRSVSRCEADCSLRWNCSAETLRNNWWLLVFFFFFAPFGQAAALRSLLLITLSDTVGRTYVPSLLRWHVSFCHDLSLIRIYSNTSQKSAANTADTCAPERTFSSRTANYGANLPKPIVTRTLELSRIIFRGVQCGT